jgi:hypothetical protein
MTAAHVIQVMQASLVSSVVWQRGRRASRAVPGAAGQQWLQQV